MSAQPGAVLLFNNNTFVILTAMTEKQGGKCIKGAFATDDNNNEAKPIAGIAMAGIMVTAALLLSGLSLISSNQQPVIAQQQNMTGGGGVTEGGATITDNTTGITGSAAQGGNGTAIAGGVGGNQSEVRMNLEQARIALQNNDTQSAMMYMDMALSALGGGGAAGIQGNMTTGTTIAGTDVTNTNSEDGIPPVGGTSAADEDNEKADNDAADGNDDESNSNTDANRRETDTEEEEDSECGGVTVGGTSAADDYGCPPDPDA